MKETTHTYTCDECGHLILKEPLLKEIRVTTPDFEHTLNDYCSVTCFLKHFNTIMSNEKLDIRIVHGDDD